MFPQRGGRGGDGVCRLVCLLGASLAGWPLAKVLDTWHWRDFLWLSPLPPGFPHCCYCPFERPDTARSVMHLTFSLHIRKTKKFSRFCLDAISGLICCCFYNACLTQVFISGVTHAGFLNQVRKPTLDLPLEVRRKMWSNRSCNPTWWSLSAT